MSSAAAAPTPAADRLARPWYVPTAEEARRFGAHLQRELDPRHVLHGRAVTPIAARADADDVVFALGDGAGVAVVHLTYAKRPTGSAEWPSTRIFPSLSAALDAVDR